MLTSKHRFHFDVNGFRPFRGSVFQSIADQRRPWVCRIRKQALRCCLFRLPLRWN
jgi:hypothetical protein